MDEDDCRQLLAKQCSAMQSMAIHGKAELNSNTHTMHTPSSVSECSSALHELQNILARSRKDGRARNRKDGRSISHALSQQHLSTKLLMRRHRWSDIGKCSSDTVYREGGSKYEYRT